MPLFRWRCKTCGEMTRKLLSSRPSLDPHGCGGEQEFVSDTQSMVMETRDNGVMPRKVEQLKDVERLMHERSTDPQDPGIV